MIDFMQNAIDDAKAAAERGEVPVGAIVALNGEIIGRGGNNTFSELDITGHAEIVAMRRAADHLGSPRLAQCDLYVTLEPCTMCAAAISFARIRRLYFGARDPKGGAVESGVRFYQSPTCMHSPEIYSGLREAECGNLLTSFFSDRRD